MNSHYETKVFYVHTEGDHRFGFTLAGQYPCQLVKIQHCSPADRAGLKSGDEVIEVNGVNVEDLKHDCVASFISPSVSGTTELRIRRATGAPSQRTVKVSGKDVHKSVSEDLSCTTSTAYLSNVVDRVVEEFKRPPAAISVSPMLRRGLDPSLVNGNDMASDEQLRASFSPDTGVLYTSTAAKISSPFRPSTAPEFDQETGQVTPKQFKIEAVVGYLGCIDRPVATRTSDLLVTHVQAKTSSPDLVLLEVFPTRLYIKKSNKQVIMTCPINSLVFVGICPENKQILGLFTEDADMDGGHVISDACAVTSDLNLNCCCHLFVIDARLIRHLNHKPLTDRFQLFCVPDPSTGSCHQFPTSSGAILNALAALLKGTSLVLAPSVAEEFLDGVAPRSQVENVNRSGHTCPRPQEPCKENPLCTTGDSNDPSQAENDDGVERDLILCLHLYSLIHTGLTEDTEMSYSCQGDYSIRNESFSRSHVLQSSSSVSLITSNEKVKSTHTENHMQNMGATTQGKYELCAPNVLGKSLDQRREGGHKTLMHRRSQSLASNVTNVLQPCPTATQTLECHSQTDFRIGNGARPVFHSSSASVTACNNVNSVQGRVARWAVAFDRLLEDKSGLNIFRNFLQKEYSEENLIFWLACENYRTLSHEDELKKSAEEIYEIHLKSCATLPVNVESSSIREVETQLEHPTTELFTNLQYQVYTLMKFDSYARFLKSDLYRQCWVDEMEGRPLPDEEDETKKAEEGMSTLRRMFGSSTKTKGWKNLNKAQTSSEAEESKKKSFLPWRGRLKSDQPKRTTNRSSDSQASSARSSLSSLSDSVFSTNMANSDEAINDSDGKDQVPPSCRVILPNNSLMYLFCKSTRSLKEGLSKLCEKKEYSLPGLDLFVGDRKLTKGDLQKKLTRFINKEIVLKQGVLFRLDLPNDKTVGVKAEAEKTIVEILDPILREATLEMKDVVVRLSNNQQQLSTSASVLSLHQQHVVVETVSGDKVPRASDSIAKLKENELKVNVNNNIEEKNLTKLGARSNEEVVFDAIMSGKRQSMSGFVFDDHGIFVPVVKPTGSKELLSSKDKERDKEKERLTRSPALFRKKKRDATQSASTFKTFVVEDDKKNAEELFTLLRRSQNSRMDDQRGTLDKKVELPDFLKLPEKPSKRNQVLNVGVPSPRPQHQPLKKSTSSPPTCIPCTAPSMRTQPSIIVEHPTSPERTASVTRNWSGSLRTRGRTQVETVTQGVTETQTIDRKQFSKTSVNAAVGNRSRTESLPQDRPVDRDLLGGNELRSRSRYHYGSELTQGTSSGKRIVWVSNPMATNRRRVPNRTAPSEEDGKEGVTTDDEGTPKLKNAEVIIPEMDRSAGRFPITGGVVPCCDRPKPITDSAVFREYVESAKLQMQTPDDQSKAHDLESANDRETILDNSFLRDQLKPSRLFSQLTPEVSPIAYSSPDQGRRQRNEGSMKCPLFIPPLPESTPGDDSSAARNASMAGNNRAESAAGPRDARDECEDDSSNSGYWDISDSGQDKDSVRVTFV